MWSENFDWDFLKIRRYSNYKCPNIKGKFSKDLWNFLKFISISLKSIRPLPENFPLYFIYEEQSWERGLSSRLSQVEKSNLIFQLCSFKHFLEAKCWTYIFILVSFNHGTQKQNSIVYSNVNPGRKKRKKLQACPFLKSTVLQTWVNMEEKAQWNEKKNSEMERGGKLLGCLQNIYVWCYYDGN